jgi:hypothetical protein
MVKNMSTGDSPFIPVSLSSPPPSIHPSPPPPPLPSDIFILVLLILSLQIQVYARPVRVKDDLTDSSCPLEEISVADRSHPLGLSRRKGTPSVQGRVLYACSGHGEGDGRP